MRDPRQRKGSGTPQLLRPRWGAHLHGERSDDEEGSNSAGSRLGHMPDYLIADELGDGRLISFANQYFRGGVVQLVAARKVGKPHGPIASKLWDSLRGQSRTAKVKH